MLLTPFYTVDSELEKSPDNLKQIDGVIREILTTGIPESPERLRVMIVILDKTSCLQSNRLRFTLWRLREDLIQIATIYQNHEGDC